MKGHESYVSIAKHTKVGMIWVAGRSPTLVSQNLKATTLTYLAIGLDPNEASGFTTVSPNPLIGCNSGKPDRTKETEMKNWIITIRQIFEWKKVPFHSSFIFTGIRALYFDLFC
jgi:hypothetical protein